jgi:hypothetical protein
MGLFGSPKIDGNELLLCLAYWEAQNKVTAFQTREADLYNNAMVKYGNSIGENPLAASEACKAAKRLSQAATEALRRHNEIENVPVAASAMHSTWKATFFANAAWASATAAAIEAMSKGMNPNMMYVQQLVKEYQKAWHRAQDEDKKFLKQLKVRAEDIARISRATTPDTADDDWEPQALDLASSDGLTPELAGLKGEGLVKHGESGIVLWKDKEWSQIDGDPCRVTDFNPLGSLVDIEGKVQAMDMTTPYASITIECQKLGKNITGYITHKIDFRHLWAAFKERAIREDEEVIITWTTRNYKRFTPSFGMPRLLVWVCPKGAFEIMTDNTYKPELSGEARSNAWIPIIEWKPDVMK